MVRNCFRFFCEGISFFPILVDGECLPTIELYIWIFLPYVGGVHMSMIGMIWIKIIGVKYFTEEAELFCAKCFML